MRHEEAFAVLAGVVADELLGDPRRFHPVAGFGRLAARVERASWRPTRLAGSVHVGLLVGPAVLLGGQARRSSLPAVFRAGLAAGGVWSVLGGRSLLREAAAMQGFLAQRDLTAARERLPSLCGREPAGLTAAELTRATIESVAENTSDAVVGPLVWAAIAGPAGAVGYRAVNTLDAMVGHHSDRYEQFGWAAARLDDAVNLIPARLTALLATLLAFRVGGSGAHAACTWRRYGRHHPSPNAGPCEAAFAGALGIRLGGPVTYAYGESERAVLDGGRGPEPADIARAARLSPGYRQDGRGARRGGNPAPRRRQGRRRKGRSGERAGGRPAGRRNHVRRRQEHPHGRPVPLAGSAGNSGGTVQGAEHGTEFDGDGGRRGDRPGQAMQAAAAGIARRGGDESGPAEPGGDRMSHVVVLGRPSGEVSGRDYRSRTSALAAVTQDSLAALRARFDVVICEGAGSPAEVNLRAGDIANMGLARAADLPVLLVGDIDRGGIFAHFGGTLGVLDAADQRHIAGFVVNKFRGDLGLLEPGLDWLTSTTGRPVYGVLPWLTGLWLDVEDSLDLASRPSVLAEPVGPDVLQVVVVRLPRMSNVTDLDPLSAEPGVTVRLIEWPQEMVGADLVVIPGTRSTVSDLQWLRERGFADALRARAADHLPVLGICGGLQVLGTTLSDGIESRVESVDGVGLLPVRTVFAETKVLDLQETTWRGQQVRGYRIHHGRPQVDLAAADEEFLDGCRVGSVWGTSWHGAFESDGFRRLFLTTVASAAGRNWRPGQIPFERVRQRRLDALGDLVEEHLDTRALLELIEKGVPAELPTLTLSLR